MSNSLEAFAKRATQVTSGRTQSSIRREDPALSLLGLYCLTTYIVADGLKKDTIESLMSRIGELEAPFASHGLHVAFDQLRHPLACPATLISCHSDIDSDQLHQTGMPRQ